HCSVHYDMLKTGQDELISALLPIIDGIGSGEHAEGELVRIPVLYGGEWGADIETVARLNSLSVDDVIAIPRPNTPCRRRASCRGWTLAAWMRALPRRG
ncbi:MAG: carboxyltransferase domain-containing protein, partial [Christensenellales bacterium]